MFCKDAHFQFIIHYSQREPQKKWVFTVLHSVRRCMRFFFPAAHLSRPSIYKRRLSEAHLSHCKSKNGLGHYCAIFRCLIIGNYDLWRSFGWSVHVLDTYAEKFGLGTYYGRLWLWKVRLWNHYRIGTYILKLHRILILLNTYFKHWAGTPKIVVSISLLRHSLSYTLFPICRKQNAFDESDDESEQLTEDFELPINPYDFYFNGKVLPLG